MLLHLHCFYDALIRWTRDRVGRIDNRFGLFDNSQHRPSTTLCCSVVRSDASTTLVARLHHNFAHVHDESRAQRIGFS